MINESQKEFLPTPGAGFIKEHPVSKISSVLRRIILFSMLSVMIIIREPLQVLA